MNQFYAITSIAPTQPMVAVSRSPLPFERKSSMVLSMLSEKALNDRLGTLKQQYRYFASDAERDAAQRKIDDIEKELVKRAPTVTAPAVADINSPKAKEGIMAMGGNVGAGALVGGITLFAVSAMSGNKNPLWYGLAGAVIGGVSALYLTRNMQSKEKK